MHFVPHPHEGFTPYDMHDTDESHKAFVGKQRLQPETNDLARVDIRSLT